MEIEALNHWPILQFAAAVLVLMGAAYAMLRGLKDRGRAGVALPSEQHWFFDGPLVEALRYLRENTKQSEMILAELRPMGETLRSQSRTLDEIKRTLDELPSVRRTSRK